MVSFPLSVGREKKRKTASRGSRGRKSTLKGGAAPKESYCDLPIVGRGRTVPLEKRGGREKFSKNAHESSSLQRNREIPRRRKISH